MHNSFILPYVFKNLQDKTNDEIIILKMHQFFMANMGEIPKKIKSFEEDIIMNYLLYLRDCLQGKKKFLENKFTRPVIHEYISLGYSNEYTIRYIFEKIIDLNMKELVSSENYSFKNHSPQIDKCTIKQYLELVIKYDDQVLREKEKKFSNNFRSFVIENFSVECKMIEEIEEIQIKTTINKKYESKRTDQFIYNNNNNKNSIDKFIRFLCYPIVKLNMFKNKNKNNCHNNFKN